MTRNQIEYQKLLETERSNRRNEKLTEMRDATTRELGFANLGEASRHNRETERQAVAVLGETQRHNLAQESHNARMLEESSRHNLASEKLQASSLEEQGRHNLATEIELNRHNVATESVSLGQLAVSQFMAEESRRHSLVTEAETERSNRRREDETERSNRAREGETERHNRAQEGIGYANVQLGYSNLYEQQRYHDLSTSLGLAQLSEQQRANQAKEDEIHRHNVSTEGATRMKNLGDFAVSVGSLVEKGWSNFQNRAIERNKAEETERSHKANESISRVDTMVKVNNAFWNAAKVAIPLFMH